MNRRYLAIIGATASGKSDLALRLAQQYGGELVNCDSVQIYRGFDIGAAKPNAEERALVPHHLVDALSWDEDFDARKFAARADAAITEIRSRGKVPIVVGGTGLYLKALWQEGFHDLPKDGAMREELNLMSLSELRAELNHIDNARSQEIHDNDRLRLQRAVEVARLLGHSIKDLHAPLSKRSEAFVISMNCPRAVLQERIMVRSRKMLSEGLIEEVRGLIGQGVPASAKPMQSIGYHQVLAFLRGDLSHQQLQEDIIIATRQYAKRQETLFKKIHKDYEWDSESSRLEDLWALISKG